MPSATMSGRRPRVAKCIEKRESSVSPCPEFISIFLIGEIGCTVRWHRRTRRRGDSHDVSARTLHVRGVRRQVLHNSVLFIIIFSERKHGRRNYENSGILVIIFK